ncbi:MAG: hypothetical protein JXA11_04675 [Phycisphaerae bacterium]|nr:hypothetical protein [Phycisphaerae bacterium]
MPESPDISNGADLIAAVRTAAQNAPFLTRLGKLLQEAQRDVERLNPSCRACGQCCNFSAKNHRLFVSTGELALLTMTQPTRPAERLECPYQQNNLCTARDRRPLGCRIFFCNPNIQNELHDIYEECHHRIVQLHQQADIPYLYGEMTAWLRQLQVEL